MATRVEGPRGCTKAEMPEVIAVVNAAMRQGTALTLAMAQARSACSLSSLVNRRGHRQNHTAVILPMSFRSAMSWLSN